MMSDKKQGLDHSSWPKRIRDSITTGGKFEDISHQQELRQQRLEDLSCVIMGAVTEYADSNVGPRVDDADVFNALMDVIVKLMAHTSEYNRALALRLFGPEVAQQIEDCRLHYSKPEGTA